LTPDSENPVFRVGGVSYLRIPAPEPLVSGQFYRAVFGWTLSDHDEPHFEDGTGHVIGQFMADLPVAADAGVWPYIYVRSIDEAIASAVENGGALMTEPYPEGDLWVATIRDPAGNTVGVWQSEPREPN
jgi:predicted enzyme related to lactoylglutathione lyase